MEKETEILLEIVPDSLLKGSLFSTKEKVEGVERRGIKVWEKLGGRERVEDEYGQDYIWNQRADKNVL